MKLLTALVFTLLLVGMAACAQTVTVTGTATINGQQESANVTLTVLPKSTVSLALPTSATNTTAGSTVNLVIVMTTTRMQPAALQFSVSGPSATFSSLTVTAGAGATAAGKSITCAAPTTPVAGTLTQICILAGVNQNTIPTGAQIANVAAVVLASAPAGSVSITLSALTVSNLFGNAMVSAISTATAPVVVSPSMAITCAPDTNSVPNALPNQFEPGEPLTCTVTLSSAVTAATTVTLSSSSIVDPGATVPASAAIASGATSQTFTATGI